MVTFYQINLGKDLFTWKFSVEILKIADSMAVIAGDRVACGNHRKGTSCRRIFGRSGVAMPMGSTKGG